MTALELRRIIFTETDTIGALFYPNGEFACWTIEDAYREEKVKNKTCIPYGVFRLGLHTSPKFSKKYGHKMIQILDVPDFKYILIHPGNSHKDTSGCICPGLGVQTIGNSNNFISNSKKAYDSIYPTITKLMELGDVYIAISKL